MELLDYKCLMLIKIIEERHMEADDRCDWLGAFYCTPATQKNQCDWPPAFEGCKKLPLINKMLVFPKLRM